MGGDCLNYRLRAEQGADPHGDAGAADPHMPRYGIAEASCARLRRR
jgi:hypothetical protein